MRFVFPLSGAAILADERATLFATNLTQFAVCSTLRDPNDIVGHEYRRWFLSDESEKYSEERPGVFTDRIVAGGCYAAPRSVQRRECPTTAGDAPCGRRYHRA